jgi:hypothetical protein
MGFFLTMDAICPLSQGVARSSDRACLHRKVPSGMQLKCRSEATTRWTGVEATSCRASN